jgi:predicted MFS family arabinose efflux permease
LVPQTRAATPVPVDRRGAALLAATILLILVPVSVGREQGWPFWCWVMLPAAAGTAMLFGWDQRRAERTGRAPLLPPSLLRQAGFRRGLATELLFFPSFGGFMLVTAVTLQDGIRMSPLMAGLALAPLAVVFLVVSLHIRRFTARLGRRTIPIGAVLLTAGLALFAAQAHWGYAGLSALSLIPTMALLGAGNALVMVPLFGTILAAVPPASAGAASGVLTTTQQVGLALGAGTVGSLFFGLQSATGWAPATAVSLLATTALAATTGVVALTIRA